MINLSEVLRCVHRHSVEEHPRCFANGFLDSKSKKIVKELKIPWYKLPGMKIGYIDIETNLSFDADVGTMLSWCIKEKDGDTEYDIITKKELFSGKSDEKIVRSLINEMKKYKILVGYYSTGFDVPYARTKALHYEIDFPSYGDIYHFDLFYLVRSKLKLSRSSLDVACSYFGIDGKTHLDRQVWRKAAYGDKESLETVLEHNLGDVKILELLHNKLEPFRSWIKKSI